MTLCGRRREDGGRTIQFAGVLRHCCGVPRAPGPGLLLGAGLRGSRLEGPLPMDCPIDAALFRSDSRV